MASMLPIRRNSVERGADPMAYFDDFANYMNRMMNSVMPSVDVSGQSWTPLADVAEDDSEYRVVVEVPGVAREDISIDMEGQDLTVSGQYGKEESGGHGHLRHSTRRSGRFEYSVRLPHAVDTDRCTAELKDGVLTVVAPKVSDPGQKRIEIK